MRGTFTRAIGVASGAALAPWTALGSYARRARVFHPRGVVLWGRVRPIPGSAPAEREFAARLEGAVLARFSSAWWKNKQWPDVLGCALRFTDADAPAVEPRPGDQDLLLATVRVPLTTPFAPLGTRVSDYLRNRYFGVSPFEAPGLGRVKLRLSASQVAPPGESREERLQHALAVAPIRLRLEARRARLGTRYRPIAAIELLARADLDQERLRFDPFRTGRGLLPVGFVHGLRVASYAASRRARDAALGR